MDIAGPHAQTPGSYVRSRTDLRPKVGVVLGSGLGRFAESLKQPVRIPYRDLPGFPISTAVGHASELVIGTLPDDHTNAAVAVLSGRFHLYEGYSAQQVASGMRLFHQMGISTVVLTCAAGGLNIHFSEGALVLIADHINLQGANPLTGPNDDALGPRFPDMTEAYSKELRSLAQATAQDLNVVLHEGIYASVPGPSYETPAEIRFLKTIGADLVGMSTAAETIAANYLGLKVLGIACVTNLAAGLGPGKLIHQEVLQVTERISDTFLNLLSALLRKLVRL